MNKSNFIIELKLKNCLNEKNKLYKVEINLYDLESRKETLFNNYLTLEDEKVQLNMNLLEKKDYKIIFKIITNGRIEKIEQIIFNTNNEYKSENINIFKSTSNLENKLKKINTRKNKISQNPVVNWREERNRTSIYNNGKLIFLKGLLEIIWKKCYEIKSIEDLKKEIPEYSIEYIDEAIKLLLEKGVLVEYEK